MNKREKANEVIGSFTGFDEISIEKAFGRDFGALNATMTMRAMAFVHHRRAGSTDKEAYQKAMAAPLREVRDLFDDDEEEEEGEDLFDDDDEEGEGGEEGNGQGSGVTRSTRTS